MSDHYILEGHKAVPADLMQWAEFFENTAGRTVALTMVGKVRVSTVFLGIDHSFGSGRGPLLFETMIFGGKHDQYQERYVTWEEAEAGHAEAVKLAEGT
jgi:hypothetical protein